MRRCRFACAGRGSCAAWWRYRPPGLRHISLHVPTSDARRAQVSAPSSDPANGLSGVGILAPDVLLDRVKLGDARDHLLADRRRRIQAELQEAPSPVRPAIGNTPWPLPLLRVGQTVVAGISVDRQRAAGKPLQEVLSVKREPVSSSVGCQALRRPESGAIREGRHHAGS